MPDLTPEKLAELRRAALIEGHDAAHYPTSVVVPTRTLLALLDAAAERDALAAKVERVRALPAKHPAGGWYMTSMRDVLAALDEEPQP